MSKSAARAAVNEAAPIIESGTVAQFQAGGSHTETTTSELRRQYLTEREVEMLCDAARKRGRYGHRDATMILMAYRHGLRCSELVALRWDKVDLEAGPPTGTAVDPLSFLVQYRCPDGSAPTSWTRPVTLGVEHGICGQLAHGRRAGGPPTAFVFRALTFRGLHLARWPGMAGVEMMAV